MIAAISSTDSACEPTTDEEFASFLDAVEGDPVATLRAAIRAVCNCHLHVANTIVYLIIYVQIWGSSIRRQFFAELVIQVLKKELQLLRDIDVRWSSTYYMIERAIMLEVPLTSMIEESKFRELRKYKLTDSEWDALFQVRNILRVRCCNSNVELIVKFICNRYHMLSSNFYQAKKLQHFAVLFLHLSTFQNRGNSSNMTIHLLSSSFRRDWTSLKCMSIALNLYLPILLR